MDTYTQKNICIILKAKYIVNSNFIDKLILLFENYCKIFLHQTVILGYCTNLVALQNTDKLSFVFLVVFQVFSMKYNKAPFVQLFIRKKFIDFFYFKKALLHEIYPNNKVVINLHCLDHSF